MNKEKSLMDSSKYRKILEILRLACKRAGKKDYRDHYAREDDKKEIKPGLFKTVKHQAAIHSTTIPSTTSSNCITDMRNRRVPQLVWEL